MNGYGNPSGVLGCRPQTYRSGTPRKTPCGCRGTPIFVVSTAIHEISGLGQEIQKLLEMLYLIGSIGKRMMPRVKDYLRQLATSTDYHDWQLQSRGYPERNVSSFLSAGTGSGIFQVCIGATFLVLSLLTNDSWCGFLFSNTSWVFISCPRRAHRQERCSLRPGQGDNRT